MLSSRVRVAAGEALLSNSPSDRRPPESRKGFFLMVVKGVPCPRCGSFSAFRYGRQSGRQRWRCRDCGKVFSLRSGTVLSSAKLGGSGIAGMALLMSDDATLRTISDVMGVSPKTAYVWRMKFYKCFAGFVDSVVLSGHIWVDEFYVPVKGAKLIGWDGKAFRGISVNQIAVAAGVDSRGRCFARAIGRGHPSGEAVAAAWAGHIAEGSFMSHDSFHGHAALVREFRLREKATKSTSKFAHRELQPINSFCAMMERNLVVHIGMVDAYLQDYLNWVCFKKAIRRLKKAERIDRIIDQCYKSRATFRSRDRYPDKR